MLLKAFYFRFMVSIFALRISSVPARFLEYELVV